MDDDLKTSKILIFDDDPDHLQLLELFFETSGFSAIHATSDARNVEALVAEVDPDLVLLDIHMPHVDGVEAMQRIQAVIPQQEIPIIVLSGDLSTDTRKRGEEAGATDFLGKPYEMSLLMDKVRSALSHVEDSTRSAED